MAISSTMRHIRRGMRRFGRSAEGMAAVEFGLLAPVLMLMFIGTIEIPTAVSLDRRVSLVAASTADLIARDKTIADNSAMNDKMKLITHLMHPFDSTRLRLSIYQVTADPANATNLKVSWSYGFQGGSAPAKCGAPPEALPTGLLAAGASVIVVKADYDYEPIFISHYLDSSVTLTDKATMSPRNSCVVYGSNNPNCMLSCG